jgi:hypothetical protein
MEPSARAHGYGAYTHGCRCRVCKAAKAAYMRARRTAAYIAGPVVVDDPNVAHGRSTYEERGCRCTWCVGAMRAAWARA